jgi:hypothetical protein
MDVGLNKDKEGEGLVMGTKKLVTLCVVALAKAAILSFSSSANASDAPYPPSPVINGVTFDFSSRDRRAPGSDNWPITWADDGHQYAAWGDGGGFGGTNSDGRVSLGIARIEGSRDSHQGHNVWGGKDPENPARFGGKSYGILSVGGVLYMWVGPGSNTASYEEARLCSSTNHGAAWTRAKWAFAKSDSLIMPTLCQFGKDYAGARDNYVYSYAIRLKGDPSELNVHKPGQVDLVRVPKDKILDRSSYEFYAGLDADDVPAWTKNIASREPVFEDPNGVGWCMSVSYNAGLRRYLLCTEHDRSFNGNLGIFDAPEPWGPWTTVGYYDNWGSFGSTFYWNFSNKWLSSNGKDFVLIFTGTGDNDAWNTASGTFSAGIETISYGTTKGVRIPWQSVSGRDHTVYFTDR